MVIDAETMAAIDVTAVTMLLELAGDLRRDGMELVLARDIGAVRDVFRGDDGTAPLRTVAALESGV